MTGARILLKQIFEFGFFHADPHPGNLRVLPGGVIAPLDYGMFGQLDARTRERIADLLAGLIAQDPDRVIRALDALDIRGEQVDPEALRRDVSELVAHLFRTDPRPDQPGPPAPGADRVHPDPPAAHPPRPGAPDPLAGDHRERRPQPRPPLRHRQAARAVPPRADASAGSTRYRLLRQTAAHRRRPPADRHALARLC